MHLLGATLHKVTNEGGGRLAALRILFQNGLEYEFTPFSSDAVEMLNIWNSSFEKVLKEFKRTEMADKFGPARVSVAHIDGDYRLSSLGLTSSGSLPRNSSGGPPPALPPARTPPAQNLQASGSGFRPGVAPTALSSSSSSISNVVSPGRGSQAAPPANVAAPPSLGTPPPISSSVTNSSNNRGSVGFRPGVSPVPATTNVAPIPVATGSTPGVAPVPLPRPPNSPPTRHSGVVSAAPASLSTPLSRNSGVGFSPGVGAAAPLSRNSGAFVPGQAASNAPAATAPARSSLRSSSGNMSSISSNSPDSPKRPWSSALPSVGLVPPPPLGSIPPSSPHREEPPEEEAPLPPVRDHSSHDDDKEEDDESDEYVSIIKP